MNEAEYLMKNYGDPGGCYPPRLGIIFTINLIPNITQLSVNVLVDDN